MIIIEVDGKKFVEKSLYDSLYQKYLESNEIKNKAITLNIQLQDTQNKLKANVSQLKTRISNASVVEPENTKIDWVSTFNKGTFIYIL
jgi:hypothetical protein